VPEKRLDGPAVARVAGGRRECSKGAELLFPQQRPRLLHKSEDPIGRSFGQRARLGLPPAGI